MAGDDGRVLAAQFQNCRTHIFPFAKILINFHPDIIRTRKGDPIHIGVIDQGLAQGAAWPGNVVENPIWQAGIPETLSQQAHRPGSIGGWFKHHCISSYQRRAYRATA